MRFPYDIVDIVIRLFGNEETVTEGPQRVIISAYPGNFLHSGTPAELVYFREITDYVLAAEAAAFVLGFSDATVRSETRLEAESGSFVHSSPALFLRHAQTLVAEAGGWALAGGAAGLLHGHRLVAAAGAYAYSGNAADLPVRRAITAALGAFNFEGTTATIEADSPAPFVATGGVVTETGGFNRHTFTENGTFTVTQGTALVYWEIVGAGAAGGFSRGGGGGGGDISRWTDPSRAAFLLGPGTYPVVVGLGGVGGNSAAFSTNGGSSSFNGVTSIGGGAGGGVESSVPRPGQDGGSGGGGRGADVSAGAPSAVAGSSLGVNGSGGGAGTTNATTSSQHGGGGGGADGVGVAATTTTGGAGGNGSASIAPGVATIYSGGGGGCTNLNAGNGGAGGDANVTGGRGASGVNASIANAAENGKTPGSGGGGGPQNGTGGAQTCGNGANGIVHLWYVPQAAAPDTATYVTAGGASANTVAMTGVAEGNLIIGYAFKTTTGLPTMDTTVGWNSIGGWQTGTSSVRAFWKYAESDDPPFGVFTGASRVQYQVFDLDPSPVNPIGAVSFLAVPSGAPSLVFPWAGIESFARKTSQVVTVAQRHANDPLVVRPDAVAAGGASGVTTRLAQLRSNGTVLSWPRYDATQLVSGWGLSLAIEFGFDTGEALADVENISTPAELTAALAAVPSNLGRRYIIGLAPGANFGSFAVVPFYNKGTTLVQVRSQDRSNPARFTNIDATNTRTMEWEWLNIWNDTLDAFGFPAGGVGIRLDRVLAVEPYTYRVRNCDIRGCTHGIYAINTLRTEICYNHIRGAAVDLIRVATTGDAFENRDINIHHNYISAIHPTWIGPDISAEIGYTMVPGDATDPRRSDQVGGDSYVLDLTGTPVLVTAAQKDDRHADLTQLWGRAINFSFEDNFCLSGNGYRQGLFYQNSLSQSVAYSQGVAVRRCEFLTAHVNAFAIYRSIDPIVEDVWIHQRTPSDWSLYYTSGTPGSALARPTLNNLRLDEDGTHPASRVRLSNTVLHNPPDGTLYVPSKVDGTPTLSNTLSPVGWEGFDVALGRIGRGGYQF